jgi:hypothetical protein
MAKTTLYVCKNGGCTLGSLLQHGRFTGGISAEQKQMLTGKPLEQLKKGVDHGEGICPNCGQPGDPYDAAAAAKDVLAEAKARYDAEVAAIKEGVA